MEGGRMEWGMGNGVENCLFWKTLFCRKHMVADTEGMKPRQEQEDHQWIWKRAKRWKVPGRVRIQLLNIAGGARESSNQQHDQKPFKILWNNVVHICMPSKTTTSSFAWTVEQNREFRHRQKKKNNCWKSWNSSSCTLYVDNKKRKRIVYFFFLVSVRGKYGRMGKMLQLTNGGESW